MAENTTQGTMGQRLRKDMESKHEVEPKNARGERGGPPTEADDVATEDMATRAEQEGMGKGPEGRHQRRGGMGTDAAR